MIQEEKREGVREGEREEKLGKGWKREERQGGEGWKREVKEEKDQEREGIGKSCSVHRPQLSSQ